MNSILAIKLSIKDVNITCQKIPFLTDLRSIVINNSYDIMELAFGMFFLG